ncbi:glutamate--tRNA ligase [Desulfoluna sp.]|uniref:glutamate--tRNA ligase n=1 Tax=Desulfoluna sp. TaxID=2045199 RepID=UPI002621168E|nr:glutamate--tRNA ligase [Desulfoluna sp.]
MGEIITRFPPSPTGYLHVGGARTALFNWLYARKTGGTFILRIEDTDLERSTEASVQAIFDGLEWLGIDWDQGPFYQTQRFDLYKEVIAKLLEEGHAYWCTCTPEEIEEMRETARANGEKPKYNGKCRERHLGPTEGAVVRFKVPLAGATAFEDMVKGRISIPNAELDDFIIQRSDGSPTYNLAVAVDDLTMKVNTILRGDDHVNNTPKQILILQAMGETVPTYGHVPMVLGSDKARLSKRHGATSVTEYRDMGILPDAMINYLARLGWSCGDQEFFTREDLIEKFNPDHIGRSPGVFDQEKLLAINHDHIQQKPAEEITEALLPYLEKAGIQVADRDQLVKAVKTLAPRSHTLVEMAENARFYFEGIKEYDPKMAKKAFKPAAVDALLAMKEALAAVDEFTESHLEAPFHAVMEKLEVGFGKVAQPLRLAVSGTGASPGMYEMLEVLGKEETLKRIDDAVAHIRALG